MTSNAKDKSHPLHAEFMEYHRAYDRSDKRKAKRNARLKQWRQAHPEQHRQLAKLMRERHKSRRAELSRAQSIILREEMVLAYGGFCICCGEDNKFFLSIDHIHNDGHSDPLSNSATGRRQGGVKFYKKLKQLGWPQDKYQLLCFNCNLAKAFFGLCPHQTESLEEVISA